MLWKDRLRQHSKALVLLGIWLVILGVPELRLLCRMQVRGSEYAPTTAVTPFIFWPPIAPTSSELLRLYPHSIEARAKAPEQRGDGELPIAVAEQRYDALLREHPDNLWLLATRLRMAVQELRDGRRTDYDESLSFNSSPAKWPTVGLAGPSFEYSVDDTLAPPAPIGVPSHDTPQKPSPPNPHIYQYLALAKRGLRLEPDNCFYDWALAYFLFALQRDEEALSSLHRGASKPYCDSHLRAEMVSAIIVL